MIACRPRRRLALVGIACSATLLLAACGGGGSSKASDATQPKSAGNGDTTTSAPDFSGGATSKCYTKAGTQTAKVRFVNLFTNASYPQGDIDVWQGYGASDGCGKKLATIKYGEASDYIDVTAADEDGNWSATAFVPGGADEDHQIINQGETWKGGEQVTIVFATNDPTNGQPEHTGSDQAFFEKDPAATDADSTLATVPGKAVLAIGASALQYSDKDGAWVAGIAGQPACLMGPDDTESTHTNIGGTSLIPYPVAPGSVSLGLYPSTPGTCTGTPAIGPTTIDAQAGSRTLVLAYGPDKQGEKLLVLPVDS